MKINLGCGVKHKEGYINIDIDPCCDPDFILDLSKEKMPMGDDVVDEVYGSHVLEHLSDDGLLFLFQELKRVCRTGCKMVFITPYYLSPVMYQMGHKKAVSERMFDLMNDWLDVQYSVDFGVIWHRLKKWLPVPFLLVTQIHFDLVVKKGKNQVPPP